MNDGFKKLKTKRLISAAIRSLICGVAAGLAAAGIALLCVKLCVVYLDVWYYVLIGLAAAVAVGVGLFFAFRGSDKSLAKEIDTDYSLQERVQTMVEFSGLEGEIVEVQRQDTSAMLAALPPQRKKTFIKLLGCLISLIAACGVFVTAAVLPADAGAVFDPGNDKYVATENQITALNILITDVNNSALEDGLKNDVSKALNELKDGLNDITVYGVQDALTKAVTTVDGLIYEANSYKTVCPEFGKSQITAYLAREFNNCIITYQTRNVNIVSYPQVENLYTLIEDAMTNGVKQQVTALRAKLNVEKNSTEVSLAGRMDEIIRSCDATLAACGKYAEDDFYKALGSYAEGLKTLYASLASYTDGYLQNTFNSLAETLTVESASALHKQSFNRMMQDFIRNKLADTFSDVGFEMPPLDDGITVNLPAGDDDGPGGNGGDGDDDGKDPGKGSDGDKEIEFGSDDKIFNPLTGEYVSYLELLDYYQNLVDKKINDGDLSPELIEYLQDYFSSLTQKNGDNQNN